MESDLKLNNTNKLKHNTDENTILRLIVMKTTCIIKAQIDNTIFVVSRGKVAIFFENKKRKKNTTKKERAVAMHAP